MYLTGNCPAHEPDERNAIRARRHANWRRCRVDASRRQQPTHSRCHLEIDRLLRHWIAERVCHLNGQRLTERRSHTVQLVVPANDA